MSQRFKQLLLCMLMILSLFSASAIAEGVRLKSADLERADSEWLLNATFQIELTPGLEDAVQKGVVLYFQTEFDLTRSRWYWFDEKAVK